MTGIGSLTSEERVALEIEAENSVYSRRWCINNGVDYFNPDFNLVRQKVFEKGFYKTHSN